MLWVHSVAFRHDSPNVFSGWTACCRRSGRAVIVASMSGFVGMAGFATYAPTKFALRGLADCLRNEVGLSVYPGGHARLASRDESLRMTRFGDVVHSLMYGGQPRGPALRAGPWGPA